MDVPGNETYTSIGGRFIVPVGRIPQGSRLNEYAGDIWIGIDNPTLPTPILQAGVYMKGTKNIDGSLSVVYQLWYELYPFEPQMLFVMDVVAGNEIEVVIEVANSTSGTIRLNNLSTSHIFTRYLKGPLNVGGNAEWIVESFPVHPELGLIDFGTVEFTNCESSHFLF